MVSKDNADKVANRLATERRGGRAVSTIASVSLTHSSARWEAAR